MSSSPSIKITIDNDTFTFTRGFKSWSCSQDNINYNNSSVDCRSVCCDETIQEKENFLNVKDNVFGEYEDEYSLLYFATHRGAFDSLMNKKEVPIEERAKVWYYLKQVQRRLNRNIL